MFNTTDILSVTIGGKAVSKLEIKTGPSEYKEVKFAEYVVTFDSNIKPATSTAPAGYFYMDYQGGTATTMTPSITEKAIKPGNPVGTLPNYGIHNSYIYNVAPSGYTSVDFHVYIEGWYKEPACTNIVSTDTVPTSSCTYYAKWVINGVEMTYASNEDKYIKLPKFVKRVRTLSVGGGGSSEYTASSREVDDDWCECAIYANGGNGYQEDVTVNVNGEETVFLHGGGPAQESYVNISGNRISTGAAGNSGGAVSNRFNVYDTSPESHICNYDTRPCIVIQCVAKSETKRVSGYSDRAVTNGSTCAFQYYRISGDSNSGTIGIRATYDTTKGWATVPGMQVGSYVYDDEGQWSPYFDYYEYTKTSFSQGVYQFPEIAALGSGGPGAFVISRGTTYSYSQHAGKAGNARIDLYSI